MATNGKLNGNGLGCLILTAVVDPGFRERLLTEPANVVTDFELTDDEQKMIASIKARSLPDFAAQLHQSLEQSKLLYI